MAVKAGMKSSNKNIKKATKVEKLAKVDSSKMKKEATKKKVENIRKVSKLLEKKDPTNISSKKKELIKSTLVEVKKKIPIKSSVKVNLSKLEIKNLKTKKVQKNKNSAKLTDKKVLGDKINLPLKSKEVNVPKKSVKIKKEEPMSSKKSKKTQKVSKIKTEEEAVSAVSENNLNPDKKLRNKKTITPLEVSSKPSKKSRTEVQKPILIKTEEIESIKSKKRKHSETAQKIKSEVTESSSSLVKKDISKFVAALLKISADQEANKKKIFDSEQSPIFLYIICIKVPKAPLHQVRIPLPHSLVQPNDEVALFVKDLKKGRRISYENTVTHYEDLLRVHGVTQVKTVIPMNQVKTEYRQFELRKKLFGLYDHFLVDGRIAGHMAHLLGKEFRQKRKLPTSIHMSKPDLKKEISGALQKTTLQIHSQGNGSIVQVGYCSMSVKEITDNIIAVSKALDEHFPGGWGNIRKLLIKTATSLSIPIYISLKNKNDVEVPVQAPKRPKAYVPVEGELSTFTSNVKVVVAPDGTVDVQKIDDGSDVDEDEDEDLDGENEDVNSEDDENVKTEDNDGSDEDLKASEDEDDE